MENKNEQITNKDQPPFLKTWSRVYWVLFISQLIIVTIFYFMTIKYSG